MHKIEVLNYFKNVHKTPIGKNIIANFFKIAVIFSNQILLVPLFLKFWGVNLYGDWIVLTAMTSFFTMSDAGLNTVTLNRFCIKFGEQKIKECSSLLINNYVLVFFAAFVVIFISSLLLYFIDIRHVLSLNVISSSEAKSLILLLLVQIFVQMISTVSNSIYFANSLASKAIYYDNLARLLSALMILIGIFLKFNMQLIVIMSIIPYLSCLVYKYIEGKKMFDFEFSLKNIDFPLFKEVLKPSITYMAFPLGNVFIFQLFTLIINSFFGASVLVLFNTSRTMTNFIRTVVQSFAHAVRPEFSIAYGKKDFKRLKVLLKKTLLICFLAAIISSIFILTFGNFIYLKWTSGKISFDIILVALFSLTIIINSIWESTSIALTSTNNHTRLGVIYLFSAVFASVVAYFTTVLFNNIYIVVLSLLVSDVIMAYFSLKFSRNFLKGNNEF